MRQGAIKFSAILIVGLLAMAGSIHAQSCEAMLSDGAKVILADVDMTKVQKVATALLDQGADVHFITTSAANITLEQRVEQMKQVCPTWKSPNGGVKANMLVFMVAPVERKMAIFYGSGYGAALNGQTDRIKRDFMGPYFKSGDWAGGLAAGGSQVLGRIKATTDESNKPVTYTTNNNEQATDFHGLWVFFWIVGGLLFGGLCLWVFKALKDSKEATQKAQQDAIAARSRAVELLNEVSQLLTGASNASEPRIVKATSLFDVASSNLTTLGNSISGDPTSEGMSKAFYESLESSYTRIVDNLLRARGIIYSDDPFTPPKKPSQSVTEVEASTEPIVPLPAAPATVEKVVVRDTGSNDLLTGVLIGEAMGGSRRDPDPEPEPEPVHHHHSHHASSDDSSSSNSDSWGGSSSSWSDSGSSFDSGSSSSFDSSSSGDSGGGFGGGSSDF